MRFRNVACAPRKDFNFVSFEGSELVASLLRAELDLEGSLQVSAGCPPQLWDWALEEETLQERRAPNPRADTRATCRLDARIQLLAHAPRPYPKKGPPNQPNKSEDLNFDEETTGGLRD